jgi:hypothetical protein
MIVAVAVVAGNGAAGINFEYWGCSTGFLLSLDNAASEIAARAYLFSRLSSDAESPLVILQETWQTPCSLSRREFE